MASVATMSVETGSNNNNTNNNNNSPNHHIAGQDVIEFSDHSDSLYVDGGGIGHGKELYGENDEVMQLAARLAPAFEEAHDLFQVPAEFHEGSSGSKAQQHQQQQQHQQHQPLFRDRAPSDGMIVLEDDDLKRELSDLEHSEQLLRQELEQANFFSTFLANPPSPPMVPEEEDDDEGSDPPVSEADIAAVDYDAPEQNLDLPPMDEEDHFNNLAKSATKKNQPQSPQPQTPQQQHQQPQQETALTPPVSPSPQRQTMNSPAHNSPTTPNTPAPILVMGRQAVSYDLDDHKKAVELTTENGWYMVNMNRFVLPASLRKLSAELPGVSDFCISCPESRLKTWYIGFTEMDSKQSAHLPSLLPVRTSVIRIRPDVLCGGVMDAVATASSTLADTTPDSIKQHSILRRQGGHLQLVVTTATDLQFFVDAQLCTQKTNQCERVLLIRIFHYSETPIIAGKMSPKASPRNKKPFDNVTEDNEDIPEACLHLREACALVQRIEIDATNAAAAANSRRQIKFRPGQSPSMSDRDTMTEAFGKHLHKTYKACPSTMGGSITLPSLNSEDWQLLKASWLWSDAIWDELDSRSLTVCSLATIRFGAFPCLPTLDAHFCSQIRRYAREIMIGQLVKSATQLEEYARESEFQCANVIALLRKAYMQYGVEPPPLPVAIPLTSYKLDYAAPQAVCPPWGLKVMEALNHVQAWVDEATVKGGQPFAFDTSATEGEVHEFVRDSMQLAARAVASVLEAFQRQDDEEKSARLQRKNSQVMDRLSVMKKHQIVSVDLLDQCTNDVAQNAAESLRSKTGIREVPLLKCNAVVGSNTGTCIVTAHHIIFVTQLLPLLGMGQKVVSFDLKEVDFELQENAPAFLNALPTIISLEKDGQEVFSFRPSGGGTRLKSFLDIMTSIARDSKSILSS